jgi:hypothetical protein
VLVTGRKSITGSASPPKLLLKLMAARHVVSASFNGCRGGPQLNLTVTGMSTSDKVGYVRSGTTGLRRVFCCAEGLVDGTASEQRELD